VCAVCGDDPETKYLTRCMKLDCPIEDIVPSVPRRMPREPRPPAVCEAMVKDALRTRASAAAGAAFGLLLSLTIADPADLRENANFGPIGCHSRSARVKPG
jgi:hypothetical protein